MICFSPFRRGALALLAASVLGSPTLASAQSGTPPAAVPRLSAPSCVQMDFVSLGRNPTPAELRCRHGIAGVGRFGLSEYMEVPVYQPATPLPGTHVVGVPGMPGPRPGESFEEWEWRVLRTEYGPEARRVHRDLELLDPFFATRLMMLEERLRQAGVRFSRRETWRSPERQAYLFQSGRSRPGGLVTATLTSWHSLVDARGVPSSRAADYNVARAHMPMFHEIAWSLGLESYGPESNDPGHVYLPGFEEFLGAELNLLRLLPRVPTVTITTGRPSDEAVSREQREWLRQAAEEFVRFPFFAAPEPRLARNRPAIEVITTVHPPAAR